MTKALKKAQSTTETSENVATHEISHPGPPHFSTLGPPGRTTPGQVIDPNKLTTKPSYENIDYDSIVGNTTSTQLTNAEAEIAEEENTNLSEDVSGDIIFTDTETSEGGIPSILGSEGFVAPTVRQIGGTNMPGNPVEEKYSPNMAATLRSLKKGGQK